MKRALAVVAALSLVPPASAAGQEAPRTDPEIGSPSESMYGIPLEEARRDAAPNGGPDSTIRSENGVGSSAVVPGTRRETPGTERPEGRGRGRPSDPVRRRLSTETAARELAGEPAPGPTILLLALVVMVAAGGGLLAGRRAA